MVNKCCVWKCVDNSSSRHRLPLPFNDAHGRFWKWLAATGNRELLGFDPLVIYKNRRMCRTHFSPVCFVPNEGKLKKNAVPDSNLPAPLILANVTGETLPGTSQGNVSLDTMPMEVTVVEEQPSTSTPKLPIPPPAISLEVPISPIGCHHDVAKGSIHDMEAVEASTSSNGADFHHARKSLFHDTQGKGSVRKKGILHELGVKRLNELTPKAKFLHKTNQRLKKSMQRSSKKLIGVRKLLRLFEKNSKLGWGDSDELSPTVSSFLLSQIREASKKSKGHRFTLDDKVLALSIMKRSGRAYNFLSTMFVLPSRRTLLRLLSCLSFTTGINNAMFDHLSVTVRKKVKDIDRHYILMFDEMSLTPHLDFQEHLDVIEGFEDLGGESRSQRFADKALVFMVRGLRRNYKQPVAYAFPSGSMKTPDLSKFISDVILKLQSSGITIHCTVCDQGSANVAAINKLCAETRQSVLRCEGEYRGDYFDVNGMKIIPLFDPSHLMKGVRNGLLTKDLKFSSGGVIKVASWHHVIQVYNIDCGKLRLVPNLTDLHVVPEKIKKMKVKYCTQVFSQRLASAMDMLAKRRKLSSSTSFAFSPHISIVR